jgi:glycerol-3-phosphate cytidylyltransferase
MVGRKIGFTIGVYDLFHRGHANQLVNAQMGCDLLIVGVVDDWNTMMQKGPERPVEPLEIRIARVKKCVPHAIVVPIYRLQLCPSMRMMIDVFFVGPDQMEKYYSHPDNKPLPHQKVVVIDRTPNISTTELFEATKTLP